MRIPQRIPIYLELLKDKILTINDEKIDFSKVDFKLFSDTWEEYPDWRLTQLLVNTGIIPNTPGYWYYMEDSEFLITIGFEAREVVIWGQNFDKDMNRLPETIFRPVKDLNTGHIEAILRTQTLPENLINLFEEELKLRN